MSSDNPSKEEPVVGRRSQKKFSRLNTRSSYDLLFDLYGEGKLDSIETTMQKYDVDKNGVFSNEEVVQIIREQIKAKKKALIMRHGVIFLGCFMFALALSNIGTSFAAMFLSKELAADSSTGVMRLRSDGRLASVQTAGETYDILPMTDEQYQARRNLVLSELEDDPHSHAHRRLEKHKNIKCQSDLDCDGDVLFDNGVIPERDFAVIEEKCKSQKNVKIRRTMDSDRKADSICAIGTSVIVKEKRLKRGGRGKDDDKISLRTTKDREVIIVTPNKKKMSADCIGNDCFISGDILVGQYGDSCEHSRQDCHADLICETKQGHSSPKYGTCLYPRFVRAQGPAVCDLSYGLEACEDGYYCWTKTMPVGGGFVDNGEYVVKGSSGSIAVDDASNARLAVSAAGVGTCTLRVDVGSACNSPFACIDGYKCIGAGGFEVGKSSSGSSGQVAGPSGVVEWSVMADTGVCVGNVRDGAVAFSSGMDAVEDHGGFDCSKSKVCSGGLTCTRSPSNGSDRWHCL